MNPSPTPGLVERLRDLATKEDGVGMSYQARGVSGGAELRLYGKRAEATYWLLSNGHGLAEALSLPTPTVDREAIARIIFPNGFARRDPMLMQRAYERADAILALLHPIDDMGSGGADWVDDISETGEAG